MFVTTSSQVIIKNLMELVVPSMDRTIVKSTNRSKNRSNNRIITYSASGDL